MTATGGAPSFSSREDVKSVERTSREHSSFANVLSTAINNALVLIRLGGGRRGGNCSGRLSDTEPPSPMADGGVGTAQSVSLAICACMLKGIPAAIVALSPFGVMIVDTEHMHKYQEFKGFALCSEFLCFEIWVFEVR